MKQTIRKGQHLVIEFSNESPFMKSGQYEVARVNSKHTMLLTNKHQANILLDIREHGKSFRIQSVHEVAPSSL